MLEKIVAYLSRELDIPAETIERDTTFDSLQLDSLDTVELVMDREAWHAAVRGVGKSRRRLN